MGLLREKRQLNSELRKSDENNNPEMEGLQLKRDKYDFDYYDTAKTRMDDLRGISEQTELYQELARLEVEIFVTRSGRICVKSSKENARIWPL